MGKEALKIYFAGDLFDSKDILGNLLLSDSIEKVSGGRYQVMLPQDGECEVVNRTSQSIRDADFKLLFQCDVIVANFDGSDLDSGTVAEFCFAKMVDMPAVLLRTDFRDSGDNTLPDGEPWNLMCSHYPRTEVCHINAMSLYHDCRKSCGKGEIAGVLCRRVAETVVAALDQAVSQPPWLVRENLLAQYRQTIKSIGGTLSALLPDEYLQKLCAAKAASGIY